MFRNFHPKRFQIFLNFFNKRNQKPSSLKPTHLIKNLKQNMQIAKIDTLRLYEPSSSLTSIQCVICHEIALNPKECQNCQNLFCDDCINAWIEIKPVCPCFCSEQPLLVRQAHKFIRDIISNLKVKCLNHNLGCHETIRFESLQNHEKNHCSFRKIPCPNGFCQQEIFHIEISSHKEKCVSGDIECPSCKIRFPKSDFEKHKCVSVLFEEIKTLEVKCVENERLIKNLENDYSLLAADSKKKTDYNVILEKLVKSRVKDLKLYMKSEVETVIQDLLKCNPTVEITQKEKGGFASKFFNNFKETNSEEDTKEVTGKKELKEGKEEKVEKNQNASDDDDSSSEEHKGGEKQKKCHEKYDNLTWMIDPQKLKCGRCSQIKLIRYNCRECRKNLCVTCKKPRFKSDACPAGHKLKKNKCEGDAECDVCLGNIKRGKICYTDEICGADVCLDCLK